MRSPGWKFSIFWTKIFITTTLFFGIFRSSTCSYGRMFMKVVCSDIYCSLVSLIDIPSRVFIRPRISLSPRFVEGGEVCSMTGPFFAGLPTIKYGESVVMDHQNALPCGRIIRPYLEAWPRPYGRPWGSLVFFRQIEGLTCPLYRHHTLSQRNIIATQVNVIFECFDLPHSSGRIDLEYLP